MSKITVEVTEEEILSESTKIFGPDSSVWSPNSIHNHAFLKAQQNYCNNLVFARGHLFLNEVYDFLGLPRTSLGQVLGWTKEKVVDFGVDPSLIDDKISLTFNPSGVIVESL